MHINSENIDEYLLLLLDGELTEAAEKEVMAIVESSPEYKALLEEYMLTRLEEESFVFEEKSMLLKPERVFVPLKRSSAYAALAAALAVIIGAGVLLKMLGQDPAPTPPLVRQQTTEQPVADSSFKNQSLAVKEYSEKEAAEQVVNHTRMEARKAANIPIASAISKTQIDSLNSLPVAGLKMMPVDPDQKIVAAEVNIRAISDTAQEHVVAINDEDTDTGRRALLNSLVEQFETMKNNVEEKAKSIRIAAVSIQLGNKEITIGK